MPLTRSLHYRPALKFHFVATDSGAGGASIASYRNRHGRYAFHFHSVVAPYLLLHLANWYFRWSQHLCSQKAPLIYLPSIAHVVILRPCSVLCLLAKLSPQFPSADR